MRFFYIGLNNGIKIVFLPKRPDQWQSTVCSRGRVVKATDLKSVGIFPRRFKSCRLRNLRIYKVWSKFYDIT